jgi:hypothetical protein
MVYLPNEILNLIFSFRGVHPTAVLMNIEIDEYNEQRTNRQIEEFIDDDDDDDIYMLNFKNIYFYYNNERIYFKGKRYKRTNLHKTLYTYLYMNKKNKESYYKISNNEERIKLKQLVSSYKILSWYRNIKRAINRILLDDDDDDDYFEE